MDIVITADGTLRCLYGEVLDFHVLGRLEIRRGSYVEPTEEGDWAADLSPVGGPVLGPFPNRSEALTAEREWLERHWLVSPHSTSNPFHRKEIPMLWLLKKITERLKTLLVASAATDLEADFLLRQTERKAELLRQAHEYEEQGFGELADELRGQALELSHESPLSLALPTLANLNGEPAKAEPAKLESTDDPQTASGTTGKRKTKKAKATRKSKAR